MKRQTLIALGVAIVLGDRRSSRQHLFERPRKTDSGEHPKAWSASRLLPYRLLMARGHPEKSSSSISGGQPAARHVQTVASCCPGSAAFRTIRSTSRCSADLPAGGHVHCRAAARRHARRDGRIGLRCRRRQANDGRRYHPPPIGGGEVHRSPTCCCRTSASSPWTRTRPADGTPRYRTATRADTARRKRSPLASSSANKRAAQARREQNIPKVRRSVSPTCATATTVRCRRRGPPRRRRSAGGGPRRLAAQPIVRRAVAGALNRQHHSEPNKDYEVPGYAQ